MDNSPLLNLIVFSLGLVGTLFMFISALGSLLLPDVFTRMHAAGKAGTLGISCLLLATGLYFGGSEIWRMVALIILFFVTAPIATTSMARAAYTTFQYDEFDLYYDDISQPLPIERTGEQEP